MFLKCKVKIPWEKGKIYKNTIKGVTYINYEYARIYKPEKKYNIPRRTTIGKLCSDSPDMMYPNANYLKYFPDCELPANMEWPARSSCLRIGAYAIIRKIMEEYRLEKVMKEITGHDGGLFLDLVAYSLISEHNGGQYYSDYIYNHPLFREDMRGYSDSQMSAFLAGITADAKMMIESAVLIIRNKMYTSLQEEIMKDQKMPAYMEVPAAIRELEKIEIIRQWDNRYYLDRGITEKQKEILKAFGMDAKSIRENAALINLNLEQAGRNNIAPVT